MRPGIGAGTVCCGRGKPGPVSHHCQAGHCGENHHGQPFGRNAGSLCGADQSQRPADYDICGGESGIGAVFSDTPNGRQQPGTAEPGCGMSRSVGADGCPSPHRGWRIVCPGWQTRTYSPRKHSLEDSGGFGPGRNSRLQSASAAGEQTCPNSGSAGPGAFVPVSQCSRYGSALQANRNPA